MTPVFDKADVDRLFPLAPGRTVTVPVRFGKSLFGRTLTGCGTTRLTVLDVSTRPVGGFSRQVATIRHEHRLFTHSTAASVDDAPQSVWDRAARADPRAAATLARLERSMRTAKDVANYWAARGRLVEGVRSQSEAAGCGPGVQVLSDEQSGTRVVDIATGVPTEEHDDDPTATYARDLHATAFRLNREDEAADIARKAVMRDQAPRDPQTGLAYSPSKIRPTMRPAEEMTR